MRVAGIIFARVGSSRFYGKVLYRLEGAPLLQRVIERICLVPGVDVLAGLAPDTPENEPVRGIFKANGMRCFPGKDHDLLGPLVAAGRELKADIVLPMQTDHPFLWWQHTEPLIRRLEETGADEAEWANPEWRWSIFNIANYPRPYSMACLEKALRLCEGQPPVWREHVNLALVHKPQEFSFGFLPMPAEFFTRAGNYRLVVDYLEDMLVVEILYRELYRGKPIDTWEAIAYLDRHPEVARMNASREQGPLSFKPDATKEWLSGSMLGQLGSVEYPERRWRRGVDGI